MTTICNRCALNCGHLDIPTAAFPADNLTPLPGRLPSGEPVEDIREFCRNNHLELSTK